MASIQEFKSITVTEANTITILETESVSNTYSIGRTSLCAIIVDEVLSGAVLHFNGSITTPGTLHLLSDGAGSPVPISITVPTLGAGEKAVIPISPSLMTGLQYFQIVINAAVAASDAVIELGLRPV